MSSHDSAPPLSELAEFQLDPASVQLLGYGFCRRKRVVVLGVVDPTAHDPITVGMVDPTDATLVRHLGEFLERPVMPVRMDAYDIGKALDMGHGKWTATATESPGLHYDPPPGVDADPEHPLQGVLDSLLLRAVAAGATTVHIETLPGEVRARFRVDGSLHAVPVALQPDTVDAFVARLCALCGIDRTTLDRPRTAELRVSVKEGERPRPLGARVNVLPGHRGAEALIELAGAMSAAHSLSDLGLDQTQIAVVLAMLHNPEGLVLVAGPRGSGCTTTFHAALAVVANDDEKRVVAVEETIEREVAGVTHQTPTDQMSIADYLRAFIRRDADTLAAGSLPDPAAALAAVEAAQSGHLVVAGLQASEPAAALSRLRTLGVDDGLLADGLLGVIAQRLVRRLCPGCVTETPPDAFAAAAFDQIGRRFVLRTGRGCQACGGTGYVGRTALFEVFTVNAAMSHLIAIGTPAHEIRLAARRDGMRSLFETGIALTEAGITTLDEVRRVVPVRLLAEPL